LSRKKIDIIENALKVIIPKITKKKKKKRKTKFKQFKCGRWDENEHKLFLNACLTHRNNWKKIEFILKKRSSEQIRSHCQKFLIKLLKKYKLKKVTKDFSLENLKIDSSDKQFLEIFKDINDFDQKTYKVDCSSDCKISKLNNKGMKSKSKYFSINKMIRKK